MIIFNSFAKCKLEIFNFLTFSNIYTINCKAPLSSRNWHYINYFIIITIGCLSYSNFNFEIKTEVPRLVLEQQHPGGDSIYKKVT